MNKRFQKVIIIGLLGLTTIGGIGAATTSGEPAGEKPSVLDTVLRSKTIRCGYAVLEPLIERDPATREISGLAVEYVNKAAARKGLAVTWEREVALDQVATILGAGKIDAFCLPSTPTPESSKRVDFAGGLGRLPLYLYLSTKIKANDEELNKARFGVIEGNAQATATAHLYPKAKLVRLSNASTMTELYDQIRYGKVEAVVSDHISALKYMRANPGIMRRLSDMPLKTSALAFQVMKGDARWRIFYSEMTDIQNGDNATQFDELLKFYDLDGNALIR